MDRAPGGRVRRSILGLLALRTGRAIDADTLIDQVWNGSPPSTARASLQMHITQIRRSLAVDGLIVTDGGGYRLNLAETRIDVRRFSSLAREGLDHLREGRFDAASESLVSALELWAEPPLRDLAHLEATHAEMTELSALCQEARIGHAEARLELSGWAPDIGELERLVETFPMDERAWRLLVIGLYRSAGQADALDGVRRATDALAEELGIEPGPRLREVEDQVLTQSLALLPQERPRVDLPGFTTRFVGRVDDVRQLSKGVLEQRLTTLVGAGGVGKTRLAVEVAGQAAPGFRGGVCYVGLEAVEDPALVGTTIANQVSAEGGTKGSPPEMIIGSRALLLVLDNCEHLVEAVAETSVDLLRACPSLSILATSRAPLGVSGENIWIVQPLTVPVLVDTTVSLLRENEAVAFFLEAARRVNPAFELTDERAHSIAMICRDLAGIPLAIELAASQCDVLTPQDVHRRLGRSEEPNGLGERGRPRRQSSIDEMVGWSLGLMDEAHQRVFERMTVFSSPVDRETLSVVCDVEDGRHLTEVLQRLAHSSLVTVDLHDETAMFGQLPPIRQAAGRRIPEVEWSTLRKTHAEHYLDLVSEAMARARTADERDWFRRVDVAIEEVRNALEYMRRTDPTRSLGTAIELVPYWYARNRITEGRHHIRAGLANVDDVSPGQAAEALKAEGTLAHAMSDMVGASRMLGEAAERYRDLGDAPSLAKTLNNLGVVAVDAGQLETARERYSQARAVFETLDDRRGLAATALNLGVVALQLEETELARQWFRTALEGFQQIGDRSEEAHAMERLSHVAHFEGDVDEARTWLFPARKMYEELGLVDAVAGADRLLAELALEEGQPEAAAVFLTRSLEVVSDFGHHPAWIPGLLEAAARVAAAMGDHGLAGTLVGAASGFRLQTQSARPVMWNSNHELFEGELRKTLGDGYPAVFARGQSLPVVQALALARRLGEGADMGTRVG